MIDKFDEHSCNFKNEAECEEEFDEDSLDLDKVEALHFNEQE